MPSVYTLINQFRKVTTVRDSEYQMCHLSWFLQIFNFYSISEWSHRVQFVSLSFIVILVCLFSFIQGCCPIATSLLHYFFFFIKVLIDVMLISIELF